LLNGKAEKFGKIIRGLALCLAAMLFITTFVNLVLCAVEKSSLKGGYGRLMDVNNGKICVDVQGTGSKIVVLLSGAGSPSPVLEMASLTEKLRGNFTVVAIEYFGYGLSDIVKDDRTVENICKEIHAVLQQLKYTRYILMAHSISGIYGLYYANIYPDEVQAFVGIDSSVPKQNDYLKSAQSINIVAAHIVRFSRFTGILRIVSKLSPQIIIADVNDFERPKKDIIFLRKLYLNYWFNALQMNELKLQPQNSEKARDMKFPETTPVLFFLLNETVRILPEWPNLHDEIIGDKSRSRIIVLDGSHYLHYQYSKEITITFDDWINSLGNVF
jgi:pimeloyl-ACP methyl ester carboxylesterase